MSIMDALIKPTVNTDVDMSEKTQNTNNIGTYVAKIEINIDKLIVGDKELTAQIAHALLRQSDEIQKDEHI